MKLQKIDGKEIHLFNRRFNIHNIRTIVKLERQNYF